MDTLAICPKCSSLNRVDLVRAASVVPICGKCRADLPLKDGIQELGGPALLKLIEKSSRPVVVDFWAPWCGPCRAFAPTYAQAAKELGSKVVFVKLNTEAHPDAGAGFEIKSIPTLAVFKNGREQDRQSGAMPLATLLEYLRRY